MTQDPSRNRTPSRLSRRSFLEVGAVAVAGSAFTMCSGTSQEQGEQAHEYSLRILSLTGVRVDSERARRVFAQAIGTTSISDDRVRIPREWVEWAIKAAPSTVDVYDRRGNLAFCLGDDRTRFGIGVTTLYYQDPMTDEVTPFARKHMEAMVRLGDALPNFDVISTVGIIQDVSPEI